VPPLVPRSHFDLEKLPPQSIPLFPYIDFFFTHYPLFNTRARFWRGLAFLFFALPLLVVALLLENVPFLLSLEDQSVLFPDGIAFHLFSFVSPRSSLYSPLGSRGIPSFSVGKKPPFSACFFREMTSCRRFFQEHFPFFFFPGSRVQASLPNPHLGKLWLEVHAENASSSEHPP